MLSNYVQSLNYNNWQSWGCSQVQYSTGKTSYIQIILDFGQPFDQNGQYGTSLLGGVGFAQWDSGGTSGIRYLVSKWITGYVQCATSSSPLMDVVVGTSNYGTFISNTTNAYWMGETISALEQWVVGNGWSNYVTVDGGLDIEMGWQVGYTSTQSYVTEVGNNDYGMRVNDYGDAAGCPTYLTTVPTACGTTGWDQGMVATVAWTDRWAWPIPIIYEQAYASNALEWTSISYVTTVYYHHGPIDFPSELTQYQACQQRPPCSDTDNTPAQGWTQLYNALTSNSTTSPGADLIESDDIRWYP